MSSGSSFQGHQNFDPTERELERGSGKCVCGEGQCHLQCSRVANTLQDIRSDRV